MFTEVARLVPPNLSSLLVSVGENGTANSHGKNPPTKGSPGSTRFWTSPLGGDSPRDQIRSPRRGHEAARAAEGGVRPALAVPGGLREGFGGGNENARHRKVFA